MNKLELVRRLSREAKVNVTGPSSTLNQTGEYLKCVEWIDEAYNDIQIAHPDWRFLRKEFEFTMTAGKADYTAEEVGITDFSEWLISDFFKVHFGSVATEAYVFYDDWEDFKHTYMLGSQQTQPGEPKAFTVKPDNSLLFYPIPDRAFVCTGEYYRTPDIMTVDDSVPIFPVRYHLLPMWRAMMLAGPHRAQADRWVQGVNEYNSMMRKMELSDLPKISFGNPLA